MYQYRLKISKFVVLSGILFLLAGCANTRVTQSWAEPDNKKIYKNLLILGISESEQNRRAFESYFVEELAATGTAAQASYKIIRSDVKINRETVSKAIEGLNVDGVIVTHVMAIDEESVYRPSMDYMPVYGSAYYGGLYSYYPHVTTYVSSPGYYTTHETYTIESNLYDVESEELVWSARTRSFAPESVEEVVVDLTRLLIRDMADKNIIAKK